MWGKNPVTELLKSGDAVDTVYLADSLPQAVRDKKLDYFISNPGIFSHMQLLGQARHLATLKIAQADDPNFSLGGVFFVRSDDEQIRTFEDMRGKSALAVAPNAFGGLAVHLGEIRARGYDPEHFFASISYTGYPMQSVLEQMRQGRSRVGMVRTCLIEEMTAKGLLAKDEFRVIGAKNAPRLRCSTSTELYPDWVFAATTEAKPEQSRQACAALFSLSDEMGGYWSVASDFTRIDELFRELRIGHYRYLRQWTFERVWMQYRWVVLGLSTLLFLGYVDDATTFAEGHGGGGSSSDLKWGRDDDEDERAWARRCMMKAARMMRPSSGKRKKR